MNHDYTKARAPLPHSYNRGPRANTTPDRHQKCVSRVYLPDGGRLCECETCGTTFKLTYAEITQGRRGRFCSKPCYYVWLQTPGNATHESGPRMGR